MQTYLFYDLETTGLNKAFDQVLQFAAIRTDMQFNEIERHSFYVRLNPDVTPSPFASITHHISIAQAQMGLCEYEAMRKIHALFNEPGTISLGYNTLRFDDEFLRFSFYRNLLPPYTHQFANACGRMDLYPITLLYYLYKPDSLVWPVINDKISLKLEHLSTHNALATGRAHDAMVDVLATLALAKKLSQDERMWTYVKSFFSKEGHVGHITKCSHSFNANNKSFQEGIAICGKLGFQAQFHAPVLFLGYHTIYKNQLLWLRLDSENLSETTENTLHEHPFVIHQKLGEPGFILPMNKRFMAHLSDERKDKVLFNKQWLQSHPDILEAIALHHSTYTYPEQPLADKDAALYLKAFPTPADLKSANEFHRASLAEKSQVIDNMRNPHLKAQAIRIMGRNFPEALSKEHQFEFEKYLEDTRRLNAIIDFRGEPRYTLHNAREDIAKLQADSLLTAEQIALLRELEQYIS